MSRSLLHSLKAKGIELRVESDRLKWRAPKGQMTPEIRELIKANKVDLSALLRAIQADSHKVNIVCATAGTSPVALLTQGAYKPSLLLPEHCSDNPPYVIKCISNAHHNTNKSERLKSSAIVKRGNSDFSRAYRPHRVSEVHGQEEIKKIIAHGLDKRSLPHALFFHGPSGTGKTTLARIIAMGLNCEKGPTSEPCCECKRCVEISKGQSLDFKNINAADYTGIDFLRKLRGELTSAPFFGPHKIYLFDECHRITNAAQNMLLKLVEDSHDMNYFIFCTTTAKTIEETLINRCMFLEFQKIPISEIRRLLYDVCKSEGLEPVQKVIDSITEKADGMARNALTLLQMAAAAGYLEKVENTDVGIQDNLMLSGSENPAIVSNSQDKPAEERPETNNILKSSGTKEWAEQTINCCTGCSNGCLYCYARGLAVQRKQVTYDEWEVEKIRQKNVEKGYRKRNGRIMFPSTHDITPNNLNACLTVLEKLLTAGNQVLIVSKPNLKCIFQIINRLNKFKDQILFRFTITATDNSLLSFWEPNAPSYEERKKCLKIVWHHCFETSVSVEPMLDPEHIDDLINDLSPMITDAIWIGEMNHLHFIKDDDEVVKAAIMEIKAGQTDDKIKQIYERHKDNPMIKWKAGIKKIVGIPLADKPGMDI